MEARLLTFTSITITNHHHHHHHSNRKMKKISSSSSIFGTNILAPPPPGHGCFFPTSKYATHLFFCANRNAENIGKPQKPIPLSTSTKSIEETLKKPSAPAPSAKEGVVVQETNGREKGRSFVATKPPPLLAFLTKVSRNTVRSLASFPLALSELAVIAALCAVGTLIEQGQSREFYIQKFSEDRAFGIFNGDWVLRLNLDHMYTSPGFLGLLVLLALSLIACTSTRQFPLVKVARRWRFNTSQASISKLDFNEILPKACLDDFGALLVAEQYQVFVKDSALYAFKGLAGRFAPIGVHAALLLIMGGATFSSTGGFHGSIMVPEGLNFLVADVMYPNGFLSHVPYTFDTEVHVNKFFIDSYENGQVSQFHSDLSLFDSRGREVSRKVMSVNDPLRYGGFTMYQTDWGISVIQVHVDGEGPFNLVAAALQTGDSKLFGTFLPIGDTNSNEPPKGISILARDLQSVVIYDSTGAFVGVRRSGSDRPITVDGVTLLIDDVIGSTGLELKLDPGVPVVYAGFGTLMLTTLISYLSHIQVWALQDGDLLVIGGKSNRRKADFRREIDRILNLVPEVIKAEKITIPVLPNGSQSNNVVSKNEVKAFSE